MHSSFRVFLTVLMIVALNPAHAEITREVDKFNNGQRGVPRELARPISKYALKKMGTPGFLLSKYMTYRKLLSSSRCTTSEKLNFAGNLLTLAGDITNHILTIKYSSELKKKFEGKREAIKEYTKSRNNNLQNAPKETGEHAGTQVLAFDYAIETEEYTQKRLETLRYFKYPALALFLSANILNAKELLTAPATEGVIQSCKTVEAPAIAAQDAAIDALPPQSWLQRAEVTLKNSAIYRAGEVAAGGTRQMKESTARQEQYGGLGPLQSANYAEEMIVGLISGLKKEKKNASFGDQVVDEALDISIRLATRVAIRANIVAVNTFMRSPTGRGVVYVYNGWVIYTEFSNLEGDIADAKTKAAGLREARARIVEETTSARIERRVQEDFQRVLKVVLAELMAEAHAASPVAEIPPLQFCLGSDTCAGNKISVLDPGIEHSYLASAEQNANLRLLRNSPALNHVQRFLHGKTAIQNINLDSMKAEIAALEAENQKLHSELDRKKLLSWELLATYEEKLMEQDTKLIASLAPEYSAPLVPAATLAPLVTESKVKEELPAPPAENSPIETVATAEKSLMENADFDYLGVDIHQKSETDIWTIISNRYNKRKSTLVLPAESEVQSK